MITKRIFGVALLIAVFCISPLTAQIHRFSSNTNLATSGLFKTDTDDFLNVNNWQNVEFDTFFTTLLVENIDGIGAGLALRAGAAYLGFGYFGTFWQGRSDRTTTEAGGFRLVTRPNPTLNNNLSWTSQISFLFGMEALGGLLLDLNIDGLGQNNRDNEVLVDGYIVTNENFVGLGALEAGLRWGRNFELADGSVLKPTLGFSYNVNMARTVTRPPGGTETTSLNGIDPFFQWLQTELGASGLYGGEVGLTGGFNVHVGLGVDRAFGDVDGSLWASYDLEIRTYDKQRTTNAGGWSDHRPAFTGHEINIGIGAWYTLDRRVSFAWSVECAVSLGIAEVTSRWDSQYVVPEHQYAVSMFGISPKFAAGVVFQALPDRLNLNASLALFPFYFTHMQIDHTNIAAGTTVERRDTTVGSARTETSIGFTWFLGDNLSFDAALNTAINARLDVTTFSALLSYRR